MSYLSILAANSSRVSPRCAATSDNIPDRVPTRSGLCFGTVTWCSPLTEVVSRMWLPVCRVSSYPHERKALTKSLPSRSRGNLMTAKTSGCEDLFLHDVQAHNPGSFPGFKVALHRIGHLLAEILHRVRLGEDGFSQSARCETAFRGFFDHEDQLTHAGTIPDTCDPRKPDSVLCPLSPDSCHLTTANCLYLLVFWSVGRRGDPFAFGYLHFVAVRRLGCLLVSLRALRKEAA